MVRNRKNKTDRSSICEETIKAAIEQVHLGLSVSEAARNNGLNRTTLLYRLKNSSAMKIAERGDSDNEGDLFGNKKNQIYQSKYTNRITQVFTSEQEIKLVEYLKKCCSMNYGLSRKETRTLVAGYANLVKSPNVPTLWLERGMAGEEWLYGFMKRHSSMISLRKPENTSLLRASAFNEKNVSEFYLKLKEVLSKYNFKPDRIFNLDETGVTTVMRPPKVIASKGCKQVGVRASGERGELVTVVGIINASGTFVPPVYVFPRLRNVEDFLDDNALTGALALGSKNGWMTSDLFVKVMEHVRRKTGCSNENKILILMDNHKSHISIQCLEYCKRNGIVLLSFPPHCSHRLQPLDIAVFGPFKANCTEAFHNWSNNHSGRMIKVGLVPQLTRKPFVDSFTPSNIISAFEKTGIVPFNPTLFGPEDFAASSLLKTSQSTGNKINLDSIPGGQNMDYCAASNLRAQVEPKASGSGVTSSIRTIAALTFVSDGDLTESPSPDMIRPFPLKSSSPQAAGKTIKRRERRGAVIYTASPEIEKIRNLEENKSKSSKRNLPLSKRSNPAKRNKII